MLCWLNGVDGICVGFCWGEGVSVDFRVNYWVGEFVFCECVDVVELEILSVLWF